MPNLRVESILSERLESPLDRRFSSRFSSCLFSALAAFLTIFGSFTVAAQEPAQDPDEGFFEGIDVEIVNIDVFVSDKKGRPIKGLGKDDFVVYRDGSPVEVENFYAVADGRALDTRPRLETLEGSGDGASRPPLELEPLAPEPASGLALAPEHRLWLIVFVDNYDLDPIERNRVLPAIRQFLGQTLHKGDQAMIVTYDRVLKTRTPFTDDVNLLFDTLDELVDESGMATIRTRERTEALQEIDRADSQSQAMVYARNYAESQMNAVGYTVDALERLIDSLGGLPGRKALLHVSSGIPMLAGEELFQAVADKWSLSEAYAEIPRHDTTRAFERAMRQANAHRVVFYTLDAGGQRGLDFGSAEYAGFVSPRLRMTLDSVVPENLQAPLRLMALETGGRAIVNRNEALSALEEAAEDFRSFYSLGISSSTADSGRYHEIKVELRDGSRKAQIRHRAGYRSKSQRTRMSESLRSALLYAHQANPLGVEVRWGQPEPKEDGEFLVPIQLKIPLRDLVLLPIGDKYELRLELYVGAVGDQGETSEIDVVPLGLRLDEENVEAARGESFLYTHRLLLSRGRKKVGVALLDVFGHQNSIVTQYVNAGNAVEVTRD